MRETSYHAVIAEMTVRALWELQNLLDCIPDALWDRCYGGAPLWQHVYHTLHELDQWFINRGTPTLSSRPSTRHTCRNCTFTRQCVLTDRR